mgnify:CR=1 FL=1
MRTIAGWLLLSWVLSAGAAEPRRQVGQVAGQPVYADQITGDSPQARADSARSLFMAPTLRRWIRDHAASARPTESEKQRAEVAIAAYAACSGNGYALPEDPALKDGVLSMSLGNVKLQKRLHDDYGGGRLLFQQAGVEAFDATRKMLEAREQKRSAKNQWSRGRTVSWRRLFDGDDSLDYLLPQDQRYYQFMGSLTTPPCTEGVLWNVIKAPVTVSKEQLKLFAQLFPMNARPVQALNGRVVRDAQ